MGINHAKGLPPVIPQKLCFENKKDNTKIWMSSILVLTFPFIRDREGITSGDPSKLRFENKKGKTKILSELKLII